MNDLITTKFKNSQKPSAIPEVRIVMAMVKEWVLVSEDTSREDFWVYVPFLELGGVYMGMFILWDAVYLYILE